MILTFELDLVMYSLPSNVRRKERLTFPRPDGPAVITIAPRLGPILTVVHFQEFTEESAKILSAIFEVD